MAGVIGITMGPAPNSWTLATSTTDFPTAAFTTLCGTLAATTGQCRYCWSDSEGAVEVTVTGAAGPNQTSAQVWMHCRM